MDIKLRAAAGLGNRETAGLLVEGFRQSLEGQDGFAKDAVALMQVVTKRLGQVGPLNVELRLRAFDALRGFEP